VEIYSEIVYAQDWALLQKIAFCVWWLGTVLQNIVRCNGTSRL